MTARNTKAFSLIEMLIVIAIISIMSGLVISQFINASNDSREVVARQQQAAVQSALSNWISQYINTRNKTVGVARNYYNKDTGGNTRTSKGRLALFKDYLDEDTYAHFISNTSNDNKLKSAAMKKLNKHLALSDWAAPSGTAKAPYPKVELKND